MILNLCKELIEQYIKSKRTLCNRVLWNHHTVRNKRYGSEIKLESKEDKIFTDFFDRYVTPCPLAEKNYFPSIITCL